MKHATCLFALVFSLFLGQAALALPPTTPGATRPATASMHEWGVSEGRAYAAIINNSLLSSREKAAAYAKIEEDAEQNRGEAIVARNRARIQFWEGYALGLGRMQVSARR